MAAAAPQGAGEDIKDGVEVCLFDESADGFLRSMRAISELVDEEPEPDFPEAEVERLSSSITFLREWRHFSYEPKNVSFTNGTESTSSRDDIFSVTLPQFSSASVPQITPQEDQRDNTVSFDFILYAGGNVWALDWCPRLCGKPDSSINCEYLAVSAHPPGSSYHKLGMPLTGRGIIQVWCLLAPFEDAHSHQSMNVCNNSKRRGRPRKIPCSDKLEPVPKGPRGRPRKRPYSDDLLEPVPKRPRGRPRKNPLPVAKFEDSSQNGESQAIILFDPPSTSSVIPDDLPLAYVIPAAKSVQSTPNKRGRGRPKKNPSDKLTGSSGTVSEDVCTAPPPTTAICAKPKRPRGRPRKNPIPMSNGSVSGADVELVKGTTCQPASFGCSLDNTACTEFTNLSIVPVDAALPLIDKLTCSSGTVSGDVCATPSPTTAICTKPKKPRGRPRKYPVPVNDGSVPTAAICTNPKKTRGRPRKYPVPINGGSVSCTDAELGQETSSQPVSFDCSLDHTVCTEFNANLSIVPVDAALPIVDKPYSSSGTVKESVCTQPSPATAIRKQPERTRVRPRKYSDTMIELGKDSTGQPVSFGCSMDRTASTESNSIFSTVAVDTSSPFTSSSTATCDNKSKVQRISEKDKKKTISSAVYCPVVSGTESQSICSTEILPNDPAVSVENALPSAENRVSMNELYSASLLNCEGNARKGGLSDGSVLPIHISPKSSNKRESSGRRGRGRPKKIPLSARTGRFVASHASLPVTTSVLTSSNDPRSLNKSDDKFIVSSLGSCGCDIEKCSVHSGVLLSDDASPAHGLYNANCKEESNTKIGKEGSRKKPVSTEHSHLTDFKEQKLQTTPKSGDPVVLVENCMEGPGPRKAEGQLQRILASNESSGTSVGGEKHKMEGLSTSMTKGSSKNDDMAHGASLNKSKNAILGCEGMEVNESNTANYTSHCNENAQENQVAPSFKNSDRVIDEMEVAELVSLKESREDDNMLRCVNSNFSSVTKDIAQPRIVLCLAHNGKVAWDIKWKPPLLSQPEQKSRLGFLAVLLGNGTLEVWEVPSPCMIQKIYAPSKVEGSDPRFLKLQPVFRCAKVKCRNRQSIPLTVDWSPSPPHDMILAGCHDGTVALWNFSTNLSTQDSKPFMCVTADSVPIRALSWAPYISEEVQDNKHFSPLMALDSSPSFPPPGAASSFISPTPASTQDPTATSTSSPAPGDPSSTPLHTEAGRRKAQRWGDDSPPSGKSGGGAPPSFLEVLISGTQPAAALQLQESDVDHRTATAAACRTTQVPTRIVLREDARGQQRPPRMPNADGWSKVESRSARKERRRLEQRPPPRRPIPADLRGRCFNCFSPNHRAVNCRSMTRCFRCRGLGHRSSGCPRQSGGSRPDVPRPQRLVWRPKSSAAGLEAPPAICQRSGGADTRQRPSPRVPVWRRIAPAPVFAGARHEAGYHHGAGAGRRRRRRPSARPVSPPVAGSQQIVSSPPEASKSVFISVSGEAAVVEVLAAVIASKLGTEDYLRRVSPASFLLVLPDGAAVARRVQSPSPQSGSGPASGVGASRGGLRRRPVWVRLGPTAARSAFAEPAPSATATSPGVGTVQPCINSREHCDVRDVQGSELASKTEVGVDDVPSIEGEDEPFGGAASNATLVAGSTEGEGGLPSLGDVADVGAPSAVVQPVEQRASSGPSVIIHSVQAQHVDEASAWSPMLEAMWPNPNPNSIATLLSPTPPVARSRGRLTSPSPLVPSFPRVYSRQRKNRIATESMKQLRSDVRESEHNSDSLMQMGNDVRETEHSGPPALNKRSSFMAKISKKTSRILPTPRTNRIRQRSRTPGAPPRRSRRIAGVEPEEVGGIPATRNKKKVMRALDILEDSECISQEALDHYSKLFTQSSSLTSSQAQALAALFGWRIPDEEVLGQELLS